MVAGLSRMIHLIAYIYISCLEINGTVYLFRENDKVLEWFDNFYLNNVDNYEKYIIAE